MANPKGKSSADAPHGVPTVHHPELFQPIEIGNCEIANRIVMAPMNVLMSSGNTGLVNDQILAYYAARARGGTGLIISECVLGTRLASRFPYTTNLHLFNGTHLSGLEELSETVHAFGSKIFIQLSIGFGRQGHNPDHEPPPAPSAIPYVTDPTLLPHVVTKNVAKEVSWFLNPETPFASRPDMPREMTREEIKSEIAEYGHSCRLAVVAGFDGLEIHAPHGYLEHQFLSPRSNKRTDEYGGSLENRMRFVLECYGAARAAVGNAIPIGIRLSGDEHMPEGIHHDELKTVVKTLGQRGIDYVHLSDGSYEALKYFFPEKDGTMLEPAESFKSARLCQQGASRREIQQVQPMLRLPASHCSRPDRPLLDESQPRSGAVHARVPPPGPHPAEAASAETPPGDPGSRPGRPAGDRGGPPEQRNGA